MSFPNCYWEELPQSQQATSLEEFSKRPKSHFVGCKSWKCPDESDATEHYQDSQ